MRHDSRQASEPAAGPGGPQGMAGPRGAGTADDSARSRYDRAAPGRAGAERGAGAEQLPAALDHRCLRLCRGRSADHDGHARRPDRPSPAAHHRRRRLRGRVGPRRLRDQPGTADRRPGAARSGRRDLDAVDLVADQQHVPRPQATAVRDRGLDDELHDRRHGRSADRRRAAGALLVGIGVPDRRSAAARPARDRPRAAARVQQPRRRPTRSGQRGAVLRRDHRRGLWE